MFGKHLFKRSWCLQFSLLSYQERALTRTPDAVFSWYLLPLVCAAAVNAIKGTAVRINVNGREVHRRQ